MAKRKAKWKDGDNNEGDKAELSDDEDTSVQDGDNDETGEVLAW